MIKPIKIWWRSVYEWLTRVEPSFPTVTNPAKDRSLAGKKRRRARRG